MRLSKKLVIAALGSATLVLNPLAALAAGPTIEDTDGPLVRIAISDTLNCSINYKGDKYNEFYNGNSTTTPADCGTFLAVGSELFGPGELKSRAAHPWARSPGRRSRKRSQERALKPIRGSSRLLFAAVDSRSRRRTTYSTGQ